MVEAKGKCSLCGYDMSIEWALEPDPDERAAGGRRAGQLARLAELHTSGALTDVEYGKAKRKVLGS